MNTDKTLVSGLTEYDIVEVFNPLRDDFTATVARSYAHNAPDPTYQHARSQYNVELKNNAHSGKKHVKQTITLPSGKSLKMPGDVARVVVTQLVKEIMQREGFKRQMADPEKRCF